LRVLLHTCCAPCSIYPVHLLRQMDIEVMGFFYRYNIHPFQECMKREAALKEYASQIGLKMIWQQDYKLEEFLQSIAFREKTRCSFCYHDRLAHTAVIAKKGKFDAFSTSLLYSKFQKHELIRSIAENIAKKYSIKFLYHDFRKGWKSGIEESKRLKMYRQQYCGCIYSEKERYKNSAIS
jgi:epoxyqueuosine reductase